MKAKTIGYYVTTGLVALAFAVGGAIDVMRTPDAMAGLAHLGYPGYLAVILGVWKLAGAVAIVVPRLPLVKEWAYAGIAFDLTGAAISHAVVGDPIANVITPVVLLGLAAASWALRPDSRKLVAPSRAAAASPSGLGDARS